jgi:glycosyl transferase family 21
MSAMNISYVLPIRTGEPAGVEMAEYLAWLSTAVELIVVDGSDAAVFRRHAARWATLRLQHVRPDDDLRDMVNGKVAGVLTGLRRATHECVVIADDDVRYDAAGLTAMERMLARADVVRPQNYFAPRPLPWHAVVDTARTLLNRISGGDWPGTIGVRRAMLIATGGYDGDVMFENLELVRTVVAGGGVESCALGLYVRRLAPSTAHFWSQRVRQAYDEFARPARLAAWLAVVPASLALTSASPWALAAAAAAIVSMAEIGRRRSGGAAVFPAAASLAAPLWVGERAICAWLAVAAHLVWGGIPYRGRIVARAATPRRVLEQRLKGA